MGFETVKQLINEFVDQQSADPVNHLVQFYENDACMIETTALFVENGLRKEEGVVLVTTPAHLNAILDPLMEKGIDLRQAKANGQIHLFDSKEVLSKITIDQHINNDKFRIEVGDFMDRLRTRYPSIRVFGDAVNLLKCSGHTANAVNLERFWNQLIEDSPFTLLCSYSIKNFNETSDSDAFAQVCLCHSNVFPAENFLQLESQSAQFRMVAKLQQQSRALTQEILNRAYIERELKRSLEGRDAFLAIASHELKTPLTSMQLYLEILNRIILDEKGSSGLGKMAKTCAEQGQRLAKLVNILLDMNQFHSGKIKLEYSTFNLAILVRSMASSISEHLVRRNQKAQDLIVLDLENSVLGNWDRARLEQVVINLINNALKYGRGQRIEVSLKLSPSHKSALLSVRDHGIGIDPKDHTRIFNRFERSVSSQEYSGLGLGLYIVQRITEAHGGRVILESELEKGSTFTLELPLNPDNGYPAHLAKNALGPPPDDSTLTNF